MGADRLVLVKGNSDDAFVTAANLKTAVEKLGSVDLLLAGRNQPTWTEVLCMGYWRKCSGIRSFHR